jgi:hypothetical protein
VSTVGDGGLQDSCGPRAGWSAERDRRRLNPNSVGAALTALGTDDEITARGQSRPTVITDDVRADLQKAAQVMKGVVTDDTPW